jgi:hypothetical protein
MLLVKSTEDEYGSCVDNTRRLLSMTVQLDAM